MTRRRVVNTAALALFALVAAACASSPAPSPSPAPGLAGTSWTVIAIGGTDTIADARPTMAFGADGQVQGTGSCNGYSGPYRLDGEAIEVGDLASTLMLCQDDAIGAQEAAFMAALRSARSWEIDDSGELHLRGAGEIIATAAQTEPSGSADATGIVGRWDLVEMGPTGDFARLLPTIEFAADGQVSGFAACNTFSGTYTTDGSTLTLGPLATTKIGCERPASAVEAEYLAALSGVTSWAVEADGRLLLDGPVPLRYARR